MGHPEEWTGGTGGTLISLRLEELTVTNETESNKRAVFDADIKESLGDYIAPAPLKPAIE